MPLNFTAHVIGEKSIQSCTVSLKMEKNKGLESNLRKESKVGRLQKENETLTTFSTKASIKRCVLC